MKEEKSIILSVDEYIEMLQYKTNEKNTIQFPLDKELHLELVKRIVQFRIEGNKK